MRPDSLIRWSASRAFRAFVLIATLFLGGTFHEWHHALDPHCDGQSSSTEHACGCAGLHAAALVGAATEAPLPVRVEWLFVVAAAPAAPVFAPHALAAPRGPPAA